MPTTLERFECRQARAGVSLGECQWRAPACLIEDYEPRSQRRLHEPVPRPGCRGLPRIVARVAADPWDRLPPQLQSVRDEIIRSRQLLQMQADWDDEGSPAIGEETWRRAATFLARYGQRAWDTSRRAMDAPDIGPGPTGSIDLHWDYPGYEMLINISGDEEAMAGFYGDDRGRISIKGKFDPGEVNEGLLSWLMKTGRAAGPSR